LPFLALAISRNPRAAKSSAVANFEEAFRHTLKNEGGYANDPDDSGGETYKGISRVHHPKWSGWGLIDGQRQINGFPDILEDDLALDHKVQSFYKPKFWDKIKGDDLNSQVIANELFDTAVIMSPRRATMFLQDCLNMLNNRATLYADIEIDGGMGPTTLATLTAYLEVRSEGLLFTYLNLAQAEYFLGRIREREKNEKYARGWIENRIAITKI